jgi:arylsulfatase A-like enzyme
MSGTRRHLRLLLLGAVATFGAACGAPARDALATGSEEEARVPGIVLLCLDTLRSDAVEATAGASGRMPALSAFARRSAAFLDMSSTAAWTAPAVASLLTGLAVARHGLGLGGSQALPQSVPSVVETLRTRGWSTAAVTGGGWVSSGAGLRKGFDHFFPTFDEIGPEAAVGAWRDSRPRDRPFFLFLHTYAAHDPYGVKRRGVLDDDFRGRAAIEEEAKRLLASTVESRGAEPLAPEVLARVAERWRTDPAWHLAFLRATPEALQPGIAEQVRAWCDGGWRSAPGAHAVPARLRAAYDDGLRWADAVVERTLAALDEADLPAGTAIAIVSDHGEAFAEHGVLGHGTTLYDEVVRVPFFLSAPGRVTPGVVSGSCSLADVLPTLLDLARVPSPGDVDGRSLLPLLMGEDAGWPALAQAESPAGKDSAGVPKRLASVRTAAAKYVVTWNARTREVLSEALYDLEADPAERTALETTALERFGERFCAAVGRVREGLTLSVPVEPACGATLR